jgi:PAS domain S-box-containing protein
MMHRLWHWLWAKSVRRQLIIGVALVHMLLMTIFVFDLVHRQREFLTERAKSRVLLQAQILAESSIQGALSNDLGGLSEILAVMGKENDVSRIMVTDSRGRVLADMRGANIGQFRNDQRTTDVLNGTPQPVLVDQNRQSVEAAAPILAQGRVIGWVWIARKLGAEQAHLTYVTHAGLIYTAVAILIGTIFAFLLSGIVTRQLRLLLAGTQRMAANQLDSDVQVTTDNEVGQVTKAFNAAMHRLSAQQEELRESEGRFGAMVETLPLAIYASSDVSEKATYINPSFVQFFGYTIDDVPSVAEWWPLAYPDEAYRKQIIADWQSRVEVAIKTNTSIQPMESVVTCKDGSKKNILWGYISTPTQNYAYGLDLTERKRAEEALKTAHHSLELRVQERTAELNHALETISGERQRLYDVLETLPIMVCVLTPDYHVAFANRSFREKFGESEGRRCYEYCVGKTQPCDFCESYTVLETGSPHRWEFATPDGDTVIDAHDFPFTDVDGSPLILEMDIDITEQRRAEEKRIRLEEQLRQAQKMEAIGTLAGGIAHDFNNILGAIVGFTEMAVDDVSDRPLVEKNLKTVLKSAMRARDLVKQILAFSRKTNYARAPLALIPLVRETVQLLRASIPTTIEIRFSNTASSDSTLASPVEVQQILMNLATNASLAMQDKGGTLEISLADIDFEPDSSTFGADVGPGEYLQLAVKDSGVGMSPDVMKRVFEPFFTTREVGQGTGMGLAVVYGIVKDLQGMVTVESAPGAGSTFRVLLPKAKTQLEEEQLPAVQIPRGKEHVLFVDDEEMLIEWGQATLERLGYTVTAVTNGTEAVKIFSSDPSGVDLVITDHTMLGLTGVQLAEALLTIRPDIPIILCTGHSETVSPEIARGVGIREYLMKPLVKQELAQAVRRVLDANKLK